MKSDFRIEAEDLPVNRFAGFSHKVVDGIRDLLVVLAEDGRVLHASHMCQSLTTLPPEALVGNHITSFMHYDDLPVFLQEFKEGMESGQPWRQHHRIRRRDDGFAPFESTFKPYTDTTVAKAAGLAGSPMCLMTTRPYPVHCTAVMDSFLDHWTTQIRLRTQLQQLQDDTQDDCQSALSAAAVIQNDNGLQFTTFTMKSTMRSIEASSAFGASSNADASAFDNTLCGSPSSKHQVDSVVGDVGIEITTSRLQTVKDTGLWTAKPRMKKRKEEPPKDYLCKECGTIDSPEWRRGPLGSKTLCNACGLRWSKSLRAHDTSGE